MTNDIRIYLAQDPSVPRRYSDNTLRNMTKKDLIKYIRLLEKNYEGLNKRYEIQVHILEEQLEDLNALKKQGLIKSYDE